MMLAMIEERVVVLIPFRVLTFFRPPPTLAPSRTGAAATVLIPFRVLTFFRPPSICATRTPPAAVLIPFRVLTFFRQP